MPPLLSVAPQLALLCLEAGRSMQELLMPHMRLVQPALARLLVGNDMLLPFFRVRDV